jgi:hypothetical protein
MSASFEARSAPSSYPTSSQSGSRAALRRPPEIPAFTPVFARARGREKRALLMLRGFSAIPLCCIKSRSAKCRRLWGQMRMSTFPSWTVNFSTLLRTSS